MSYLATCSQLTCFPVAASQLRSSKSEPWAELITIILVSHFTFTFSRFHIICVTTCLTPEEFAVRAPVHIPG